MPRDKTTPRGLLGDRGDRSHCPRGLCRTTSQRHSRRDARGPALFPRWTQGTPWWQSATKTIRVFRASPFLSEGQGCLCLWSGLRMWV